MTKHASPWVNFVGHFNTRRRRRRRRGHTSPGPRLAPRMLPFVNNLIILPKQHIVLCAIEKCGFTTMQVVADRVDRGHVDLQRPRWFSFSPAAWQRAGWTNMTFDAYLRILKGTTQLSPWRTVVVLRSPLDRFLSAYQSKCIPRTPDAWRHCGKQFGFAKPSLISINAVAERLRKHASNDPHWAPQSAFCGGTVGKHLQQRYTHRILMTNLSRGILNAFEGAVSKKTMDALRRLLPLMQNGSSAVHKISQAPPRGDGMDGGTHNQRAELMHSLTNRSLTLIHQFYRSDYRLLEGEFAVAFEYRDRQELLREYTVTHNFSRDVTLVATTRS